MPRGELDWLRCDGRVLSFTRSLAGETLLCAVNAGDHPALLSLPDGRRLRLEALSGGLYRLGEALELLI